jgi:hypothetical protein
MSFRFLPLGVLCSALLFAGCQTVQTTAPGAVGVDRKQQMLVSEEDIEKGAEQAYAQEVQKARKAGKLNEDPQLTARVRSGRTRRAGTGRSIRSRPKT